MKKTHGMSKTKIYKVWRNMRNRCGNKNATSYDIYGGRGISVCKKWESFIGFYEDMGSSYKDGLSLDRINNNGDYTKENCRWVTRREQQGNKSNNVYIKVGGEELCLRHAVEITGVPYKTAYSRINQLGWDKQCAVGL